MCIYTCIYIYIHIVCISLSLYIYIHICLSLCIYIYIYMRIHVDTVRGLRGFSALALLWPKGRGSLSHTSFKELLSGPLREESLANANLELPVQGRTPLLEETPLAPAQQNHIPSPPRVIHMFQKQGARKSCQNTEWLLWNPRSQQHNIVPKHFQ